MDDLENQLKRYADAAERRVRATPAARPTRNRSRRRLLAVAAVLALVGGSIGAFALTRGTKDRIDTVPADTTGTVEPVLEVCPEPSVSPRPDHLLQVALPWVGSALRTTTVSGSRRALTVRRGTTDVALIEVFDEPPATALGADWATGSTIRVLVCDPFRSGGSPTSLDADVSRDGPTLTVNLSDQWTVTVSALPDAGLTVEDLAELLSGIAWPDPADERSDVPVTTTGERPSDEPCAPEPEVAIEVGSLTVTDVPEGYEARLPVKVEDSGVAVDLGGTSSASLALAHPDAGTIDVTSFAAPNPGDYVRQHDESTDVAHANARTCSPLDGRLQRSDHLVTLMTGPGTLTATAQTWEYEGFMVTGPADSEAAILEVIAGLRFAR